MKQIVSTYSFNKTTATVTLTDFSSVNMSRLLLITNVTANVIIYQFNNPALGGTASGNTVTLTYDTSAMNNTDKLQVIYDTAVGDPRYDDSPSSKDLAFDVNGNLKTNLSVALSKDVDSIATYPHGSDYRIMTASTLVNTGTCKLTGIWVSAASATPTIKVWDSTSATGTSLVGTFTPTASTMYTFPFVRAITGMYVTISGTVDCTVFYDTASA